MNMKYAMKSSLAEWELTPQSFEAEARLNVI
jgi:hypothetical protein